MNKYSKPQNQQDVEALKWKMSHLENQLTGEMDDYQFEIRQEIYEIKQLIGKVETPPKPDDSNFECFGCGS
jgi:thymidylate synthase ThyX